MSDSSYDHHTEPTESGHELKTADVKKYSGMDELGMQGSPKQPHTDTPKTDAALAQLKTDVATSTPSSKANVAAQAAKTASRTASEFSSPENHSAAKEAHKTAARVHVATGDLKTAEYHAKKAEEHSSHYANPKKYRAPSGQELLAKFLPKSTTTSDLTKLRGKRVDEHPSHLAEIVHATLPKVPDSGRFGDRKVFTHEVYNAMSPAEQAKFGGTVDKFKDKLVELQKSQHVTLSRADMPQAMDAKQVAASHVSLEGGKHEWGNKLSAHANFVTATGPIPTATVTPKADAALEKLKSSHGLEVGHVIEHEGDEGRVEKITATHVRVDFGRYDRDFTHAEASKLRKSAFRNVGYEKE
jgi:uncharacterized protein YkvS